MDPITIGFFLVVGFLVACLMLFMFKSFGREKDFEEVYGQNALRLLSEEKANKSKPAKSSKKSKATTEKKKEGFTEKETLKHEKKLGVSTSDAQDPATSDQEKLTEMSPANEGKQQKRKGRKHGAGEETKPQGTSGSEKRVDEVKTEDIPDVKFSMQKVDVEDEPFEPVASKTGEKRSRKRRSRKLEEQDPQLLPNEIEEKITVTEAFAQEMGVKQSGKQKSVEASFAPQEITKDAFLSRLSDVQGIEPEYIEFAVTHFAENAKVKELNEELEKLKKQSSDRGKLIAQCTEKISVLSKKDAEIQKLKRQVDEEKKKCEKERAEFALLEKTIRGQQTLNTQEYFQMQEALKKQRDEIAVLKQDLAKANAAIFAAPSVDVVKQADLLRNEVNSYKTSLQQRESELKQKNQLIDNLMNETKEVSSYKISLQQREAELKQKSQLVENLMNEAKDQQRKIDLLTQSNSLATQRAKESEAQVENAKKTSEEKCQRLDNVVNELQAALKEKTGKLERIIDEEKNRASKLEKQVSALEGNLRGTEVEREKLIIENMQFSSKLASMEADYKAKIEKMMDSAKQCEEDKSVFSHKLNAASEQIAGLSEENVTLSSTCSHLKEEIAAAKEREDHLKTQLDEEIKKSAENMRLLEAEKKQVTALENELLSLRGVPQHVELEQKAKEIDNVRNETQHESVIAEVQELQQKLSKQQAKNEELRASNYQLVEVSQKQEQNLLKKLRESEEKYGNTITKCVKEMAKILSENLPEREKLPSLPTSFEADAVMKWLKQTSDMMKTKESYTVSHRSPKMSPEKARINAEKSVDEAKVKKLEERLERYRIALASVSSNIEVIEQEAAAKKRSYEKEIKLLRSQIATLKDGLKREAVEAKEAESAFVEKTIDLNSVVIDEEDISQGTKSSTKVIEKASPLSSTPHSEEEWVVV